ncbi:hypothetical protein SAMN05192534_12320 [Alteribacillus persepolensis]|uniref:Uncharacterized protein n=1 Tax=Alteribacillus persepolensis TaxID=568899 RepID=A0A1G8I6V8_9BACI|nr:hypothetical protein [Alteribacillus persepolensis]SDI14705.1 hypothetical protein SAMN05192534_12320 [Alteribacillus persepolensis]
MEEIKVVCYGCKGMGERNFGFVAEGMYPNIETYYKGFDICDLCEGVGEIIEPHPKYF